MSERGFSGYHIRGKWTLQGYDTFEEEYYSLPGEYDSKEQAMGAAEAGYLEIEETQPEKSSGGQADEGIQDRIYIVAPDGSRERYIPFSKISKN